MPPTTYIVTYDRDLNTLTPSSIPPPPATTVQSGDSVQWQVNRIEDGESLVVKSSDPYLTFTNKGAPKGKTLPVKFTYPLKGAAHNTYAVSYDISIETATGATSPTSGFLVIDTIGMGRPIYKPDHDGGHADKEHVDQAQD